jgi:hypothetical protein
MIIMLLRSTSIIHLLFIIYLIIYFIIHVIISPIYQKKLLLS